MNEVVAVLLLFAAGVFGGIITGMLGIGGGIIYVLIFSNHFAEFDLASDVEVKLIIAHSVFSIAFAGLAGSIKLIRIQFFFFRQVITIGLAGLVATILVTYWLAQSDFYSKEVFTMVFSLFIIPVLIKMLFYKSKKGTDQLPPSSARLVITGLISGSAMSLSGLGGGFVIVPALNGIMNIPVRKTVSISIGVISLVALGLSVFNLLAFDYSFTQIPWMVGAISLATVLPVLAGVLIGGPLGVKISHRVPTRLTKLLFVSFCVLVILMSIMKML